MRLCAAQGGGMRLAVPYTCPRHGDAGLTVRRSIPAVLDGPHDRALGPGCPSAGSADGRAVPFTGESQGQDRRAACPMTWAFRLERVTRIEPVLSAWEICGGSRAPNSLGCNTTGSVAPMDGQKPTQSCSFGVC
jgi:hypothetical protein